MKTPTKSYNLQWFSLNEGQINCTESVVTNNPKMMLFNFACKMLVMLNSFFGSLPMETIIKNIKSGHTSREHYWIEYPNGEILSIMETINKSNSNETVSIAKNCPC